MASDMEDEEFDDDEDDEEEEEEEEDFFPGGDEDDDSDDDEDDDDDDEDYTVLGIWSLDEELKIVFQGDGFCLVSTEPVPWNLLDPDTRPARERVTLTLVGPCDFFAAGDRDRSSSAGTATARKPTPRTMEVTWTVAEPSQAWMAKVATMDRKQDGADGDAADDDDVKKPAVASPVKGKRKADDDDNDDDNDSDTKQGPPLYYHVHGSEITEKNRLRHTFVGIYNPRPYDQPDKINPTGIGMHTRVRLTMETATAAPTAAASPAAAAARMGGNRDDDEDDDETEGAVDYDELIALHEDAGLSVDTLRKRYRDSGDGTANGAENGNAAAHDRAENKKTRRTKVQPSPAPPQFDDDDDDDDDDDVEF